MVGRIAEKANQARDWRRQAKGSPTRISWRNSSMPKRIASQEAFRILVGRHGSRVLGICRHILNREHDAEDAFQATFLALARNGASIRDRCALASWLHEVAYRTALKTRARRSRRQTVERQIMVTNPPRDERDDQGDRASLSELRPDAARGSHGLARQVPDSCGPELPGRQDERRGCGDPQVAGRHGERATFAWPGAAPFPADAPRDRTVHGLSAARPVPDAGLRLDHVSEALIHRTLRRVVKSGLPRAAADSTGAVARPEVDSSGASAPPNADSSGGPISRKFSDGPSAPLFPRRDGLRSIIPNKTRCLKSRLAEDDSRPRELGRWSSAALVALAFGEPSSSADFVVRGLRREVPQSALGVLGPHALAESDSRASCPRGKRASLTRVLRVRPASLIRGWLKIAGRMGRSQQRTGRKPNHGAGPSGSLTAKYRSLDAPSPAPNRSRT